MTLVDHHNQYFCHGMVDTLHAAVPDGVVEAGGDCTNIKKIIDDVRTLRAELEVVVRDRILRGHSRRGVYQLMRVLAVSSAVIRW